MTGGQCATNMVVEGTVVIALEDEGEVMIEGKRINIHMWGSKDCCEVVSW